MPQMTPGAARAVDPVLTQFAIGYQQAGLVAPLLFPRVNVSQRGGSVMVFGKEQFTLPGRLPQAPGANVPRVPLAYGKQTYSITDYALDAQVPRPLAEEALAGPGVNLAMGAVAVVRNIQQLRLEVESAALARTLANYATSNRTTLSGSSQWSNPASSPLTDVEVAKEAVRTKVGRRPNTMILGAAVLAGLRNHPVITDRIKYTGRDTVTADLLAALFGVERIGVGDAVQSDDNGTFSDVWGKDVVLGFTDTASVLTMGTPTYGATYAMTGYPLVEPERWDADSRSWIYGTSEAATPVLTAPDAGYLIQNAVA